MSKKEETASMTSLKEPLKEEPKSVMKAYVVDLRDYLSPRDFTPYFRWQ